jgi:hypothetical protein
VAGAPPTGRGDGGRRHLDHVGIVERGAPRAQVTRPAGSKPRSA